MSFAKAIYSKRATQKAEEATSYSTGNKTVDKLTKVSRTSPQNNSKTVESEAENRGFDKEIPKERYISSEKGQKTIDHLRLI